MALSNPNLQHFYGSDQFPNKSFKIYRLQDIQSGQMLHTHDYMQIWYIARGRCDHWVEGIKHSLVAGEAFVIPPEVPHRTVIQDGGEIIGCEFNLDVVLGDKKDQLQRSISDSLLDLSFMMLFFPEASIRPKYAFSVESQITVERVMSEILAEYEQMRKYGFEIIQVEILHLLLLFAREYKREEKACESEDVFHLHKEAVKATIDYIDQHYYEKLSLDDVCKRSMLSKTYFCYLFKKMTNKTFLEYLVGVRINRAKRLLAEPEEMVTEVAYKVGFNDAAHFSRTFRKVVGMSPTTFRKHYSAK